MPLRVLIVPDKFKGTLSALQAAESIAEGWRAVRPNDYVEQLPMSDGGDGYGAVLGHILEAERRTCATVTSAGESCDAQWWYAPHTGTAIVETAQVIGLATLPAGKYHPFELDTFGIGAVFQDVARSGARLLYVGLGGSSTNDGGFGLARALGWRFWAGNNEVLRWTALDELTHVTAPSHPLSFESLIIAVDVSNPLLGIKGASRIYGPQKGLREESDMLKAEACLQRLAEVVASQFGQNMAVLEGAGAAGGLGFGLKAFCAGKFESGGEIFSALSGLENRIQNADVVITAEGALDAQSLMGKGVGLIAEKTARAGKRCICLAGAVRINAADLPGSNFQAYAIVPDIAGLEESMAHTGDCLQRLASSVAGEFQER